MEFIAKGLISAVFVGVFLAAVWLLLPAKGRHGHDESWPSSACTWPQL